MYNVSLTLNKHSLLAAGVPHDGVKKEEIVGVHVSVTVIFILLASAGVIFAAACLIFNFVFRKRR